ncbi:MAG TPA: hypothetical protein PKO06_15800, partial [Candidatus Ozemobacteraceae bacterium]|nr:hypothetical protein [Candidatus Ozemobacteraceae bacterium]
PIIPVMRTSVTLPTVVPANAVRGNLVNGIRPLAGVEETALTGATVTVRLSNGQTVEMTEEPDQPGTYRCQVRSLVGVTTILIEARKGELVIQNLITDPNQIDQTEQSPLVTSYLTTTFAQVALAFAQREKGANVVPDLSSLMQQAQNLQLQLTTLRNEILAESQDYTPQLKFVANALKMANAALENTVQTILEKLKNDPNLQAGGATFAEIMVTALGAIAPPTLPPADEVAEVTRVLNVFLSACYTMMTDRGETQATDAEVASLTEILDDSFLLNGMDKANFVGQFKTGSGEGWGDLLVRQQTIPVLKRFEGAQDWYVGGVRGTLTLQKKDDSGSTSEYTVTTDSLMDGWRFNPNTNFDRYESFSLTPFEYLPVALKKVDGKWKIVGNQLPIFMKWLQVNVFGRFGEPATYHSVFARFTGHLKQVKIKGPGLGPNELTLTSTNDFDYAVRDGQGNQVTVPPEGTLSNLPILPGQSYEVTLTDRNDLVKTLWFKVPSYSDVPLQGKVEKNTSGDVVISWQKPVDQQFARYTVQVQFTDTQGATRYWSNFISDINTESTTFPKAGTIWGAAYTADLTKPVLVKVDAESLGGVNHNVFGTFTLN